MGRWTSPSSAVPTYWGHSQRPCWSPVSPATTPPPRVRATPAPPTSTGSRGPGRAGAGPSRRQPRAPPQGRRAAAASRRMSERRQPAGLRALAAAAEAVARGDVDQRVPVPDDDPELADAARAFNQMLETVGRYRDEV